MEEFHPKATISFFLVIKEKWLCLDSGLLKFSKHFSMNLSHLITISPAAKSKAAIEKVTDAIEKKVEDGDLTKTQIKALIADLTKRIKQLEILLKKAK